jgi:hypothetical protein
MRSKVRPPATCCGSRAVSVAKLPPPSAPLPQHQAAPVVVIPQVRMLALLMCEKVSEGATRTGGKTNVFAVLPVPKY